ncbi:hypothetical protein [Streptomyces griseomycini]|uniref:Uncharacterized protein n=1 Tax=Streptomyces griseomycini TaxID=66895 RepID=A0A7W7PWI0_9ACTN|nr:hypothetical protein [Streptomyces griseomycini]MBB4902584.1 hypothetical protein [Streptomyces griseomycini]GGR54311.1 hypothetical protein GCM10015536_69550 [Streptomyces griseomycini]
MSTATSPQGRDWSAMRRADFDEGAPLALVDTDEVKRPVLAVPDAYGTDALFGDEPTGRRAPRTSRSAPPPAADADTLF